MKRLLVVLALASVVILVFALRKRTEKPVTPAPRISAEIDAVAVTITFAGEPSRPPRVTDECRKLGARPSAEIEVRDGRLANVLVRVVDAPASPAPKDAAVIDQRGCSYEPRLLGVVAGQRLDVRSSDPTAHNVHTYVGEETCFNRAQTQPGTFTPRLCTENGVLAFKCDIHPWMTGFVHVLPNAYFAVSGTDGVARLSVPRGSKKIEAWHETLGTKTVELPVTEIAFP